ncbi:putative 2OG-Fe(II) oxygenase [Sphingomonas oligophenolica]|uniref:2OG-Fe(II) oxygenase n=1 Tax=Sphingomonas oligophenolica TaxID=301154 RepID=A0ABU9Y527_9SPHN
MTFAARLESVRRGHAGADELANLAELALAQGEEEAALPFLVRGAERSPDARLWQWTGLLQRALDEHEDALASFGRAARIAPFDASIARGRAQVAFEAGLDAVALFEHARRLAPEKGDLLLALAAARLAVGRGEEAIAELDAILAQAPLWLQGHAQLAQLRAVLGHSAQATASIERALAAMPAEPALWTSLFDLSLRREDFAALEVAVGRARTAGQDEGLCSEYAAVAAAERDDADRAAALFDRVPAVAQPRLAIWRIRHFLRTGQLDRALRLIDNELKGERAAAAWPYAAMAWRLAGDARSGWLEADSRLVATIDLGGLPSLDRLAALLRSLHIAKGEYLDQSVRGGTQTDGPLFSRIDPLIRSARTEVVTAIGRYIADLPDNDASHPLLRHRRDRRIRFAGSWSVRLRDGGYHANHVHPQGWISSALYVALPARQPGESPEAGWLALGEPQAALGVDLRPTHLIEPREGRLVLFPSWMWHGTRPFANGERLTIAFDVAPPR